ncbi:MAG: hypothetical protein Q8S27_11930 [Hoeflea sp.]|nr:hypothetical protein [Hoeflea sp.]
MTTAVDKTGSDLGTSLGLGGAFAGSSLVVSSRSDKKRLAIQPSRWDI